MVRPVAAPAAMRPASEPTISEAMEAIAIAMRAALRPATAAATIRKPAIRRVSWTQIIENVT